MFPLVYTAWVSVHDWSLLGGKGDFVGLDNYREVLDNPYFCKQLVNTISIFLLSSVPQILIALGLAAPARQPAARHARCGGWASCCRSSSRRRGRDHLRQPVRRPLRPGQRGARRWSASTPSRWHTDRFASHVAIATMVNWRWTGYNALIFLAAMQAVPRDLYEAAAIDGAGRVPAVRLDHRADDPARR